MFWLIKSLSRSVISSSLFIGISANLSSFSAPASSPTCFVVFSPSSNEIPQEISLFPLILCSPPSLSLNKQLLINVLIEKVLAPRQYVSFRPRARLGRVKMFHAFQMACEILRIFRTGKIVKFVSWEGIPAIRFLLSEWKSKVGQSWHSWRSQMN